MELCAESALASWGRAFRHGGQLKAGLIRKIGIAMIPSTGGAWKQMLHVAAGYKRLADRAERQETKRYVDGASFGPEVVKAMGQAFDSAWSQIADNFRGDRSEIEVVRLRLANALLSVASEDSRDAQILKQAALQRFALDYWRL